jgi:predicted AAA+ superfamily ATPase
MRAPEIDAELTSANPWWQDPGAWEPQDVQLRAVRSSSLAYEVTALDDLQPGGLYILRGPRRVGKSTALKQLVRERIRSGTPARHILHASVEGRSAEDVADIVRRGATHWLEGEAGQRLWLLDEITAVHGSWPATIKRLRDGHVSFAVDTVVLTGSSAAKFDEAGKLLAGRRNAKDSDRILFQMPFVDVASALGTQLPPSPRLSFADLADDGVVEAAVSQYRPWLQDLVDAWDQYLQVGGYPQAVASLLNRGEGREAGLVEALWDVIHGDAFAGSSLTHTQTQAILRVVAGSLTSLLSVHSVAQHAMMASATAAHRLDALRRAFVAFPVPREQGLAPKPRSQSKWYFTDPALARLASAFGAGSPPVLAALSEQQLALSILRALERRTPGAAVRHDRLLYYRSASKAEIDFVSADFATTCVESKFVDRGWGRVFQTIDASGRSTGIVATRSGLKRHEGGWALPAGFVAFLVGS